MDLYHLYNKALVIKQDEDQETKRINLSLFDTLSISSSIPWIYANLFRVCSDIHDLSLIEEDLSIIDWMIGSSSLFNYQSNASNQQWNSHCSQELNASIQQYILYNTNYRNNQYFSSLFYQDCSHYIPGRSTLISPYSYKNSSTYDSKQCLQELYQSVMSNENTIHICKSSFLFLCSSLFLFIERIEY